MSDILEGLTDAQRQAVTHINGPLLVVAGPGSGKTRVITRRIAYLVHCGIRPWDILAITFTNKAANEMRRRVDALVTEKGVWMSTFHAFCARHLRKFADRLGYERNFTIFDAADSRNAIARIMKDSPLPHENWKPASLQAAISRAKNHLLTPEDFAEQYAEQRGSEGLRRQAVAKVYKAYQEGLRKANAMDFDDLLMQTTVLLKTDADVLAKLRKRHQFVLVDEFQDTSPTQYTITKLITEKHRNLCATGDPDQSIYGWRGADIANILDFESDYPDAKVVFLDRNYRSTQTIISAADSVVANNAGRKPRRLYTTNPEGGRIHLAKCSDSEVEAAEIARIVSSRLSEGDNAGDIAVFYRVNRLSRQIEEAFIKSGIPYEIIGGVAFYNRKEVKDVLAYVRVAANGADETSLLRIINTPHRFVGRKTIETLLGWARDSGLSLLDAVSSPEARAGVHARARKGLESLSNIIGAVRKAGLQGARAAIEKAISETGYVKMLKTLDDEKAAERLDNLKELINAAAQFDEGAEGNSLAGFLEQVALVSDIDTWQEERNRVTLMTMHAAKGLEFPVVIIAGLEEGILPHERSSESAAAVEEERRIFFVAMTRAKETLYITTSDRRRNFGGWQHSAPSRFLREIPADLVETTDVGAGDATSFGFATGHPHAEAKPPQHRAGSAAPSRHPHAGTGGQTTVPTAVPAAGMRVRHKMFGMGVVESVTPQGHWHKATINFARAGSRKVIIEKAPLEIITT